MAECDICRVLTDGSVYDPVSVKQILTSTDRGCHGCALLARVLTTFPRLYEKTTHVKWHMLWEQKIELSGLRDQQVGFLEVFVDPGVESPWPAIGASRSVSLQTWGPSRIGLVRQWMESCAARDQEFECPKLEPKTLPTRVLDVGSVDEEIRLRDGNGEMAWYIALSHCWGGHVPIQTTKQTLEDHFRAIKLDESSQTFVDAVQVCRDLSVRYLWIDSLCIVQDDDEDWSREAGKMGEVYRNASLTISAEAARDARDGLFKEVPAWAHQQVNIDWTTPSGGAITLHVRLRSTHRHPHGMFDDFAHSSEERSRSKLADRAWALQERLLSPRLLRFFSEEIAWSCCMRSFCECRVRHDIPDKSAFKKFVFDPSEGYAYIKKMHEEWPCLVAEYTRRKVTRTKDRLPAIAGLAKLCNEHTSSRYYAGLFEDNLEYGMLWSTDYDAQLSLIYRNPHLLHIPTWSWASTTGPVKYLYRQTLREIDSYYYMTVEPVFKVLAAEVTLHGPNVYTDVDGGLLQIEGQLLRVQYDAGQSHLRPWDDFLASLMPTEDVPFNPNEQEPMDSAKTMANIASKKSDVSDSEAFTLTNGTKVKQPKIIPDVLTEPVGTKRSNEWYLLRAARYLPCSIAIFDTLENLGLLLEKEGEKRGMAVFKRRAMVLYCFPLRPFWDEKYAPTQVFGLM